MPLLKDKTEKTEPTWIRYIRNRIKNHKNFLVQVTGSTGSGKSWSAIQIALMLDKNFDTSRIVFGLRGLMNLINSGEKYPAGSVFLWDEFQIDSSSRNWQSLTNRLLNSLLSTFRHKNFILIITTPYSDFIDSQARKLMHAEFITTSIDYKTKKVKLKPMVIQYNSRNRKFYYKYLRVQSLNGMSKRIERWGIDKPPKWIVDDYETMKIEFTTQLNKDIGKQLDSLDKPTKERKPLTDIQKQVFFLMKKYNNTEKVAEKLGITPRTIRFHLQQGKKKGYNLDNFEESGE